MDALRADRQDETVLLRVPLGECGARLHVVADQPVVAESHPGDVLRPGESRVGLRLVAKFVVECAVAAMLGPDERSVGVERMRHQRDGLHVLVVDLDQFRRVLGERAALGDHARHRVADIGNLVAAQNRDIPDGRASAVGLLLHRTRLEIPEFGDIGPGQHEMDARCLSRRLDRSDSELRPRGRRAQHVEMQRAGRREIVGISAAPEKERVVLLAQHGCAHSKLGSLNCHGHSSRDIGGCGRGPRAG